ncbi:MAG: hypothetical protein JO197_05155 [Acidobacteria bacterium]|nr:hypothetical protein [Acidobacteriota bacterium]
MTLVAVHRAPAADESDDQSQAFEAEHVRGAFRRFLSESEHQQFLDELQHLGASRRTELQWERQP